MTTTLTVPAQDCPTCGLTANKYAFGPSRNYLGCANGHVFRVVVEEAPDFVKPQSFVTETGTVLHEGEAVKCHCGKQYDAYNNDGRCLNGHPIPREIARRCGHTPEGFYTIVVPN